MPEKKFSYIKSLSNLHAIFFGGQFLLALILAGLVYVGYLTSYPYEAFSGTLAFFGLAIFVFCRLISQYLYKRRVSEISDNNQSLKKKLDQYMSASIQRWVIMEFAILFNIILIYLSGNWILLIINLLMIVLFFLMRPTTSKTLEELDIDVDKIK